ncbi:putative sulfurtransferase DsrE [subsurface metagenome]|jgi:sulfur relay (sulfurtransferase) complex TusBCD TusD component (DsrE family)
MVVFTFIVCAEPYKFEAIDTMLNLGEAILKKGHQILGIFFYGSGVYNIKREINISSNMRNLPVRLENFIKKNNLNLSACSTWVNFTGLKSDDFIEEARQVGLGGLSEWMAESDRVIVFGPGV